MEERDAPLYLASHRLRGEGDHEVVEGVAAPSGRCLRSGHKNSVKGKGAIKHKGAPTIIYHCTDAPFRLAPLATHPLSGGGQEKDGCPLPSRSARHPPPLSGVGKKNMDAPFHLALLATHPPKREWAGKIRRRLPREAGGRKADTI